MKTVIAAILVNDDQVLLAKRKAGDKSASKWVFPGGTGEDGEKPQQFLKREMKKAFEIDVIVGDYFNESIYYDDNSPIRLLAYKTYWAGGEMKPKVNDDYQWVHISQLINYDLAPADIPLAREVMKNCL
jgi:8-oxo-dGTP diphosphatase